MRPTSTNSFSFLGHHPRLSSLGLSPGPAQEHDDEDERGHDGGRMLGPLAG